MQRRRHHRRIHHRVILWVDQHWKGVWYGLVALASLFVLLTLAQLVYPTNRTLPFVKVAGTSMGSTSAKSIEQQVSILASDAVVSVKTDNQTFTRPLTESGVSVNATATARKAADYPWWQRILPLSSVFIMAFRDTPLDVQFNESRLADFAQQIANEGSIPAKNATATIEDGRVRLVEAQPSKTYPVGNVTAALHDAHYSAATSLKLIPVTQPASRTNEEVEPTIKKVQSYIDAKLVLNIEGQKIKVPKDSIGSWLALEEGAQEQNLRVGVDQEKIQKYLRDLKFDAYKAPGTTTVRLVNDREVSRKTGPSGHGVQVDKGTELIAQVVMKTDRQDLAMPTGALEPTVQYDKHYSNSDKAFASLVQGIASAKGDYGIAVMEMDGRSATARGDRQYIAASTYKIYVAYAVFKYIEAGRISWSDSISGSTVEKCFEIMITKSDNPCAHALGKRIGWANVQQLAYDIGVSKRTTFTTSDFYTTASDIAHILYRMENRSIISEADHARIVRHMKVQVYRDAIPAGTHTTVADKPGFLYGLIHDAGIVYGSKGTYIMVIMTDGSSWSQMADAARQIHAYVNK